jgi:hypothetical protein
MYERLDERIALKHHLRQGASILMIAPRRLGKTWLMGKLGDDMAHEQWNVVSCDVEGMADEAEFLKHLCDQIDDRENLTTRAMGHLQQRFRQLLSDGGWANAHEALVKLNWKTFSEALVKSLNGNDQPTLILVDEMSLFVAARLQDDQRIAREFLYHLRRLRQRYIKVRWLFTGSIGLDVVARGGTLSGALLDLIAFPIQPFSSSAARAFVEHLCRDGKVLRPFHLADDAFAHFERELGWLSPYYLEHVANQVKPTGLVGPTGRPIATVNDIDQAFNALLAPHNRLYFCSWEEHITKNFERSEQSKLRLILDACSCSPEGEQFSTLQAVLARHENSAGLRDLQGLLDVLVSGGFLREVGSPLRYCFQSGLLRRYWTRYHRVGDLCSSPSTTHAA